jgi:hypothetical protein
MAEVHMLTVHAPYEVSGRPPVNATIVSASTLLHPAVPQPAGRQLHDALTQPSRRPNELVPISTLAFEKGGNLASYAPEWEAASLAVIRLAREQACDAMPMTLTAEFEALMINGPKTRVHVYDASSGEEREYGPEDRAQALTELQAHLDRYVADGPFWPGFGERLGS